MEHPRIIQGGMGVGVSWWRLARTVSALGQLGVVSGVALEILMTRRLQDGDPGGHVRRALERFPFSAMAKRAVEKFYIPGGRAPGQPYAAIGSHRQSGAHELHELCILGNFVEVALAREGHDGPVGINYLEKIQLPHLPSIYGAMLAGVAYVVMGAGIPTMIPGVLDGLADHRPVTYSLRIAGAADGADVMARFTPCEFIEGDPPSLIRPLFLPIVASSTLAASMVRRSNGRVDGFIVEGPTAGGHNAPPRGPLRLSERGEPIYGERDLVDPAKLRELGLPFWMAGGYATPEGLRDVLAAGGAGIQVGTAFALCEESGLDPECRRRLLATVRDGTAQVFTDPLASPTGFPFKVAELDGTLSEEAVYRERPRICDLGYLRDLYVKPDGTVGYRCPSEPVAAYLAKGGKEEDTHGRKCICNSLVANVGMAQVRADGWTEPPLLTCGNDLVEIGRFLAPGSSSYSARDVIETLLGRDSRSLPSPDQLEGTARG